MTPLQRLADGAFETPWPRLSVFIAETMGLDFPRERLADLQRGLAGAAGELGFRSTAECVAWLLTAPVAKAQLEVLASHLTIGETYFFRDKKTFEALATSVLPELIRARRRSGRRLRFWSAACSTGEEAYSLAILLHQVLPDLADWRVTILATDINPHALRKADAGTYGEWSFRDAPGGFKERYFNRTGDGRYAIRSEIKQLVTFEYVNLAEDVYPSLATDTNAMDLIFCRNVLMYFTAAQMRKVIGKLHRALADGGWLAVSPTEASHALFPQFLTQNFPGVILYQRSETKVRVGHASPLAFPGEIVELFPSKPESPPPQPGPSEPPPSAHAVAASCYEQGRYREAADILVALCATRPPEPELFSLLARALANQGNLVDALVWCERWIVADKLHPSAHYMRAMVLLEQGHRDEARRSLERALYLDSTFVLSDFALGNLARSLGAHGEAHRHFANALHALGRLQPDAPLPEADGLTAGRLNDIITGLIAAGQA